MEDKKDEQKSNGGQSSGLVVRCPWGWWDMRIGMWQYNPNLKMSEEEQYNDNIKNGFLCSCGKMPSMCNCI